MGVRRGALTFTRFTVTGDPPRDLRKRYMEAVRLRAFQPLKVDDEAREASGWCVMEHPFDLEFDSEKVFHDRYLLLGFRVDRWRIPPSLLNAEMANEEQRLLGKLEREKLNRRERQELKQRAIVRLRRKVLPLTNAFDVCWDLDNRRLLFFSHSARLILDFAGLFEKTFGLGLVEDSPYIVAQRAELPKTLARALEKVEPLSLSTGRKTLSRLRGERAGGSEGRAAPSENEPEAPALGTRSAKPVAGRSEEETALFDRIETTRFLGSEFLLWLWARAELLSIGIPLKKIGDVEAWLDNNLAFESPLDRKERVTVRGAAPADSAEAKEAVKARKYPVRAKLALRVGERSFGCTLTALRFALAGGVIPGVLTKDSDEAFLERLYLLEELLALLDKLFAYFLAIRLDASFGSVWEPAVNGWLEGEELPPRLLRALEPAEKHARTKS